MIKKIDFGAVKARGNRIPTQEILKNMQKLSYHGVSVLARSARKCERKLLVDILINDLAQKPRKYNCLKI